MDRVKLRRRSCRRGGSIVEFEIIAVFFFILVIGALQYGLTMYAYNTMTYITREAARYAAVHYGDSTFASDASTSGSLKWYVTTQLAPSTIIQPSDITFPSGTGSSNYYYRPDSPGSNLSSGYAVTVQLQYNLHKKDLTNGLVPTGNVTNTTFLATAFTE